MTSVADLAAQLSDGLVAVKAGTVRGDVRFLRGPALALADACGPAPKDAARRLDRVRAGLQHALAELAELDRDAQPRLPR